jgi:hypothetical protein
VGACSNAPNHGEGLQTLLNMAEEITRKIETIARTKTVAQIKQEINYARIDLSRAAMSVEGDIRHELLHLVQRIEDVQGQMEAA